MAQRIESINTQEISNDQIHRIWEIEQDMWARGIWEYVRCNDCGHIHGKDEMFDHLASDIQQLTVKKIFSLLNIQNLECRKCWWDTKEIYWENYIENIQRRYKWLNSFLSTYQADWEIQWFADSYTASYDEIFHEEFETYYDSIWKQAIKDKIDEILWIQNYDWEFITVSSIGLTQTHSNLMVFFKLLSNLFQSIPDKFNKIPGLIEVDDSNCLSFIYKKLWAKKIDLWNLWEIQNKNPDHHSNLYIIDSPVALFKQSNTQSVRKILKYF